MSDTSIRDIIREELQTLRKEFSRAPPMDSESRIILSFFVLAVVLGISLALIFRVLPKAPTMGDCDDACTSWSSPSEGPRQLISHMASFDPVTGRCTCTLAPGEVVLAASDGGVP